jgi:hypothetical protein
MRNGFRRTGRGIEVSLGRVEAGILSSLLEEVARLLEPPPVDDPLEALVGLRATAPDPPDDPMLARLLPDPYPEDPAAAAEFRRRGWDDLRSAKRDAARRVLAALPAKGGRVTLDENAARDWMTSINDVRLALGVRLDLTDDASAAALEEIGQRDPRRPVVDVYLFLGMMQEQLMRILLDGLEE